MKALAFEGTVSPEGKISIPDDIAGQIPSGESLHVVLQWDARADEDTAWRTIAREQFEAAYAPEDDIYDQLMNESPAR